LMRPDNAALMLQEMLKNQTAMDKELYKILPDKIEENTRALEQKIEDLIARQLEIINENERLKEQIKQSCGGVGE
ncbi:hypothetical protein, partial [Kosakonia cowanii]|uniref:hypothetical protein n=1 Tax=Kosakonia cowanii TaxID=208223 RepID=UPI0039AF1C9D